MKMNPSIYEHYIELDSPHEGVALLGAFNCHATLVNQRLSVT